MPFVTRYERASVLGRVVSSSVDAWSPGRVAPDPASALQD
jgi:hypothetical protein